MTLIKETPIIDHNKQFTNIPYFGATQELRSARFKEAEKQAFLEYQNRNKDLNNKGENSDLRLSLKFDKITRVDTPPKTQNDGFLDKFGRDNGRHKIRQTVFPNNEERPISSVIPKKEDRLISSHEFLKKGESPSNVPRYPPLSVNAFAEEYQIDPVEKLVQKRHQQKNLAIELEKQIAEKERQKQLEKQRILKEEEEYEERWRKQIAEDEEKRLREHENIRLKEKQVSEENEVLYKMHISPRKPVNEVVFSPREEGHFTRGFEQYIRAEPDNNFVDDKNCHEISRKDFPNLDRPSTQETNRGGLTSRNIMDHLISQQVEMLNQVSKHNDDNKDAQSYLLRGRLNEVRRKERLLAELDEEIMSTRFVNRLRNNEPYVNGYNGNTHVYNGNSNVNLGGNSNVNLGGNSNAILGGNNIGDQFEKKEDGGMINDKNTSFLGRTTGGYDEFQKDLLKQHEELEDHGINDYNTIDKAQNIGNTNIYNTPNMTNGEHHSKTNFTSPKRPTPVEMASFYARKVPIQNSANIEIPNSSEFIGDSGNGLQYNKQSVNLIDS